MKFRTEIQYKTLDYPIRYEHKILSLGSCFSVDVLKLLKDLQYSILTNPSGITFNPVSILSIIKIIISPDSLPEAGFVCKNDIWSHLDFHSQFNQNSRTKLFAEISSSLYKARDFLKEVDWVIVTLGTAFVFEDKESNQIVNNCHKLESDRFKKSLLSVRQIVESLEEMMHSIDSFSGKKPGYIFTVSPVRHIKEGLHENQISKATCLLAINDLVNQHERCHYFPSYEIMLDDLRDYRFYKSDLIHPTDMAIEYVFEQFENFALDPKEKSLRSKINKVQKALNHRPLNPESESYAQFVTQTHSQARELESLYPFIDFNIK